MSILFTKKEDTPVRLGKQVEDGNCIIKTVEEWLLNHSSLCLLVCFIVLSFLFAVLLHVLTGVSAVESGIYYNHMEALL